MHTQQLTLNHQQPSTAIERSSEAAIASEIAAHFLQYRDDISARRALSLLRKLNSVAQLNHESFWLVCSLLSGDLSEITRSYENIGQQRFRSKQAVQQGSERAIDDITPHFPQLAQAIIELRSITAVIPHQNVA